MASPKLPGGTSGLPQSKLAPPRPTAPPVSAKRPASPGTAPSDLGADSTVEAALEASMNATLRTTTSLSGLLDALGHFTQGIAGAQEAGERLRHELGRLRRLLAQRDEERLSLQSHILDLETQLEVARHDSDLEQSFVRDEQDRFIAALMEEYELEIQTLKEALAGQPKAQVSAVQQRELEDARDQIERLLAEREVTRDLVQRAQRQRDEAQKEKERLEIALQQAQAELRALAFERGMALERPVEGNADDTHTRPTEPPPRDNPYIPRAHRHEQHASSSLPPHAGLPDFEQAWDLQAIPAPPPSLDETHRLAPDDPTPRRITAPPAELQAALTSPFVLEVEEKLDGEHIPASEELPVAFTPVMLPVESSEPPRSRKAAATKPGQRPHSAEAVLDVRPAPSAPSSSARPTSVYPDPYRLDDKPPLKRKPDHSLRPLVDYSKSAGEIAPEQLNSRIPRVRT